MFLMFLINNCYGTVFSIIIAIVMISRIILAPLIILENYFSEITNIALTFFTMRSKFGLFGNLEPLLL